MTDRAAIWYEMHGAAVLSFICSRGFALEEAEDIRSQVFLEVVRRQDELHDRSPRALLFMIAHSRMSERWKTIKRRGEEELGAWFADKQDVESVAIENDSKAHLHALIVRLRKTHRTVLTLRFIEGKSLQETAAILQVSVGTVKARQARAKGAIRRLLEMPPKPAKKAKEPPALKVPEPCPLDNRSELLCRCLLLEREVYDLRSIHGTTRSPYSQAS